MKLEIVIQSAKKGLSKAYLKEKVARKDIMRLKTSLQHLHAKINEDESEEHLKNLISDFLDDTWYKGTYEINTKDRKDLVIHLGKTSKSPVGVLIEVKRPSNTSEMMSTDKNNTKALHELILYYLRERHEEDNIDIKNLIITNIYEWYIFDEKWFEKNIYRSNRLTKEYNNWKESGKDTKFFYDSIIKPFLDSLNETLTCTHFDLREFISHAVNPTSSGDAKLIPLYKILSPSHLLKLPFANDSNSLNRKFYAELLHIMGLEEKAKLIDRKKKPEPASLIENIIIKIEDKNKLSNVESLSLYGGTKEEQLFQVALELCITWINRILFLKLLEAQLFKYHNGNTDYLFLNLRTVFDFGELNNLFFSVLAEPPGKRHEHIKEKYSKVPYLNSSLFEQTLLEKQVFDISALDNRLTLPIISSSVFNSNKKDGKLTKLPVLDYLFRFLDAYDFTSEGSEEIQEEDKNLISASVLGLIFEKINGYKDGSIYTPGFITMYITRKTIRRSVLKKFNEQFNLNCSNFDDLKNYIAGHYKTLDIISFNNCVNEIKICDPAVGSGHFLVSALNELLSIKAELGILADRDGVKLSNYDLKTENDELIITYNDNTEIFQYSVSNNTVSKSVQRIQKTIFHEKQLLIENCLFGVDINNNSVKICRLRLWIELLKHAYYTEESGFTELETLPNIDINIKPGHSLINRFSFTADLKEHLENIGTTIDDYKLMVQNYKNASDKKEKADLEKLIENVKSNFRTHIGRYNDEQKKLDRLQKELNEKYKLPKLFEKDLNSAQKKDKRALEQAVDKKRKEIESVRQSKIYRNAFEWRFEFPEILDRDGNFIGFDVIIGNPPYVFGGNEGISEQEKKYYSINYSSGKGKINLFTLFIERAFDLLKPAGEFSYIIPNTFLRVTSYYESRKILIEKHTINIIKDVGDSVFEDAITTAIILIACKSTPPAEHFIQVIKDDSHSQLKQDDLKKSNYVITISTDPSVKTAMGKITVNTIPLGDICKELIFGVVITKNKEEVVSAAPHPGWKPFLEGRDIGSYRIKPIHSYLNYDPKLLHRPRTAQVFDVPEKLLLQRITGGSHPLKAAYDNKQYYNKESINNVILLENSGYEYKYILALLNSKLINWYYTKQFTNESRLTVNLSKEYLSQIPIAKASERVQKQFSQVVDYLLCVNIFETLIDQYVSNDHIATAFTEVVDAMVYELYFPSEFSKEGLYISKNVETIFTPIDPEDVESTLPHIQDAYQQLRQKDNPVRNALKLMDIRLSELIMPFKTA